VSSRNEMLSLTLRHARGVERGSPDGPLYVQAGDGRTVKMKWKKRADREVTMRAATGRGRASASGSAAAAANGVQPTRTECEGFRVWEKGWGERMVVGP
jgi:hypothetical protein